MEEIWLTTWDVKNLMKNGIFTISAGAGLLPSTVSHVTLIATKIWWSKHYNYILTSPPPVTTYFSLAFPPFFFFAGNFYGFSFASFKARPISPSHTVSMILPAINAPTANMPAACWRVFFWSRVQLLKQERAAALLIRVQWKMAVVFFQDEFPFF